MLKKSIKTLRIIQKTYYVAKQSKKAIKNYPELAKSRGIVQEW